MDLQLTTCEVGSRTVVAVAGEVDLFTAPQLREHLLHLIADGQHHLVIDLTGVEFLDSTGLALLLEVRRRICDHDGSLRLVCTREWTLKIFRISGLDKVFPIYDHVFAAVLTAGEARADVARTDAARADLAVAKSPAPDQDPGAKQDAGVV